MRTILVTLLLVACNFIGYSQKEQVLNRLKEIGIPTDFIEKTDNRNMYAFQAENITHSAAFDTVNSKIDKAIYEFNPNANPKYLLKSYDGHLPTEKELQAFNKKHNAVSATNLPKVDVNSLSLVSEDNQQIVIGFKIDPKGLTSQNSYLKNCIGEFHLDKQTKRLTDASFHSTQPFNMSILKVIKLDVKQQFMYMQETGIYVAIKDETHMQVEMPLSFGNAKLTAKGYETTVYSNFKKVNN